MTIDLKAKTPLRRAFLRGLWQREVSWHQARISRLSLGKLLHRFYSEIDRDDKPLLLQCRVHDSTGYVQPTKEAPDRFRGTNSIYRNYGIQTWALNA